MEGLFSPCTRLRDLLESQGRLFAVRRGSHELLRELNLDVSIAELLSAESAFTYADLYTMLRDIETLVWLTPHAAVARNNWSVVESCRFRFDVDGKEIFALAHSREHLLEICDVVLRLLAASVAHSVTLDNVYCDDDALINAPTLAYLMEQCQSLKFLRLEELDMDEDHCRVLGANSRPGLEIELYRCKLSSAGTSALAEVLGRNQGPTKLAVCGIDYLVLTNGLRGNSRLTNLTPSCFGNLEVVIGNRELLAIAGSLRENNGLVELDLSCGFRLCDETWGAICDSLKTHPTLEVLNLCAICDSRDATMAPEVLTSRVQALLHMMKINLSIHTIHLGPRYRKHEIYRKSVFPHLETNRFRPRLLAIQKTRPITYRAKVLGRALLSARTDANSFWMLLSGSPEVAFPSGTTTIVAAANLPTPATAAASSTSYVAAAVFDSLMSVLTATATGSLPTAAAAVATSAPTPSTDTASASDTFASTVAAGAANVATPSADQKRKPHD
jgi:hypothetical protein